MAVLIRVIAQADGRPLPISGQYVKFFDFDADNGRGYGEFTHDPHEALQFLDSALALEFWRTISPRYPTRWDGAPNRPLTSTTVEIVKLPE